jgi:GxxExxY protein
MEKTLGKVLYPELSYKICGISFNIHNKLGRYCNEHQYADAIEHDLKELKLSFEREKVLPNSFEGEKEGRNRVDFLIEEKIILEIKAKRIIAKDDYYQVKRYLTALKKELVRVIN